MADASTGPGGPTAAHRPRSRKAIWFRAIIGFLTLGLMIYLFDPREIIRDLASADGRYVGAGTASCVFILLMRAVKWKFILLRMGIDVSLLRLLEVYTISYWFSTFLPGSMGSDLYRVYDVAKATDLTIRPTLSVIIDRLTGVLALLILTTFSLVWFRPLLDIPGWILPAATTFAATGVLASLALILYFNQLWLLLNRLAPWTTRLIASHKMTRYAAVSLEVRNNPRLFIEGLLFGLVIQTLVLFAYYLMARAISDQITLLYFYTLYPLVEIASMVPISINGMGVREGLTVLSLKHYHITPAVAMSMGILFRLVAMALALAGGLLLYLRRGPHWTSGERPAQT